MRRLDITWEEFGEGKTTEERNAFHEASSMVRDYKPTRDETEEETE